MHYDGSPLGDKHRALPSYLLSVISYTAKTMLNDWEVLSDTPIVQGTE